MENRERMLDEAQLRDMSTGELVRHAIEEARLLARAEVLHARQELREELAAAKVGGILLGAALVVGLCGLSVLFAVIAVALPISEWLAFLLVGVGLLLIAGICAAIGVKNLPKKPLPKTQERLKLDLSLTKEELLQ